MKHIILALLIMAMAIPMTAAVVIVVLDRRRDPRLKRKLPIAAKVLSAPGDSLRTKLDEIGEQIDSDLVGLALMGSVTVGCWALIRMDWTTIRLGLAEIMLGGVGAIGTVWLIRRLRRNVRLRRLYREGLVAERFTAQELNRLAAAGCVVFHDVPGDGFNIDHVVIGNGTVFAVETKSRRKADGPDGHRVRYDGRTLQFPDHASTKPLEQADRNARWLAKKLELALGRPVPVAPVVALPGWYVDATREAAGARVRVMPVGGKSAHFMVDTRQPTDPTFRNMVSQAVSMLYPVNEPGNLA